jgi:hypothetical protein
MRFKVVMGVLLLTLLSMVLGATVFRDEVAAAAEKFKIVEAVGSTPTHITALTPPSTLSNEAAASERTESAFTTTLAGKLHLTKPFNGQLTCLDDGLHVGVWSWISLDGVPVRSSLFLEGSDIEPIHRTLVGVTDTVVPAGRHTMRIEAMCDPESDAVLVSSSDFYNAGVAMVIAP